MSVNDFLVFVRDKAFPAALKDLETLTQPEDVRLWRKQLVRDLAKVLVTGESLKEATEVDVDPQEYAENKEELSFPRRVYYEAHRVQDEVKMKENELNGKIQRIKSNIELFKESC